MKGIEFFNLVLAISCVVLIIAVCFTFKKWFVKLLVLTLIVGSAFLLYHTRETWTNYIKNLKRNIVSKVPKISLHKDRIEIPGTGADLVDKGKENVKSENQENNEEIINIFRSASSRYQNIVEEVETDDDIITEQLNVNQEREDELTRELKTKEEILIQLQEEISKWYQKLKTAYNDEKSPEFQREVKALYDYYNGIKTRTRADITWLKNNLVRVQQRITELTRQLELCRIKKDLKELKF